MQAGTNRVQKVGIAYEVEKKMEQVWDYFCIMYDYVAKLVVLK